jgi:hypothetical protein
MSDENQVTLRKADSAAPPNAIRAITFTSPRPWFALLADKQIKRGVHHSIHDLKADIAAFIKAHNDDPKPFIWTKTADAILQTIARYCSDTIAIHTPIS